MAIHGSDIEASACEYTDSVESPSQCLKIESAALLHNIVFWVNFLLEQ